MRQLINIQYTEGTIKNPQHTKITQAAFTATTGVYFPDGRLQTIPASQVITPVGSSLLGGCRSIHGVEFPALGFIYQFGTNTHLYNLRNSRLTNITPLKTSTIALGSNPLATTDTDKTVVITQTAHGYLDGDRIKLDGIGADVNGIPQAELEKEHIIALIDADSYSIESETAATSTAAGGGASVTIQEQIDAGRLDQAFPAGVGAGLPGAGLPGAANPSASGVYEYARIWSFDDFGSDIIMANGDGNIYIWDGDVSVAPTILTNAPTDCDYVFVVNNSIVALCGNTVKISEIGNGTVWSGSTYYINELQNVSKLRSGIKYGNKGALLFTENQVFILRFVGGADLWDLADVSTTDGIVSPSAAVELNGVIYWRGRNNFYRFAGSFPEVLENTQNGDYIENALNFAQSSKVFATVDIENSHIIWAYPTGDGTEPVEQVWYNEQTGSFTLHTESRTAAMQQFIGGKQYFANAVSESVSGTIYQHFLTDTSLPVVWSVTTAESFAGDGGNRFRIHRFIPDSVMTADINVTYNFREYPQSSQSFPTATYTITPTKPQQTVRGGGRLRSITISGTRQTTLGAWKEEISMMGKKG